MKRKILSFITVLSIILTVAIPFASASGTPSDWATAEINAAKTAGLITDKVSADYQANITREQFCELAVLLYEKLTGEEAPTAENKFTDTNNEEIVKASGLGIVNGISETEFAPGNSITRQELAVMIVRTISVALGDDFVLLYNTNNFDDDSEIADWAFEYVQYAYNKSIIKGIGDNKIDPLGTATCEQAILIVNRVYDNIDLCKVKISETTTEIYDNYTNVNESLSEISNAYTDEYGYVKPEDIDTVLEQANVKALELKESGELKSVSLNKEYGSISMVLKNGYKYIYAPPVEGYESFGSDDSYDIEIITADYFKWSEEVGEELGSTIYNTVLNGEFEYTTMNDCVNMIKDVIPDSKSHWKKNGTSVSRLKNLFRSLNSNQKYVILWRGHGNLYEQIDDNNPDLGSIFWVSELATKNKIEMYSYDLDKDNIILYNNDFAVTNKFFNEYMSAVDEGMFYAACCYSAADNGIMSSTIKNKGFSCYLGSTHSISHGYNANMMYRTVKFLCEYENENKSATRTISDALNLAKGNGYASDWGGSATISLSQNEAKDEFRIIGDWKTAYAKFLREIAKEYSSKKHWIPSFELAYVTDDDIPELVVIYGSAHIDGAYVYTFHKNKVIPINYEDSSESSYGIYGTFHYKERDNLIYTGNMHHGYVSDAIIEIKDNVAYTKHHLGNNSGAVASEADTEYWEGDNDLSKAEYDLKYALYGFNSVSTDYKVIEYGSAKKVDEATIKSVFEN